MSEIEEEITVVCNDCGCDDVTHYCARGTGFKCYDKMLHQLF